MVFPAVLPKVAARWLFTFYRAARKLRRQLYHRNTAGKPPSTVSQQAAVTAASKSAAIPDAAGRTVVYDMHAALLRTTALFPYFMLVACEGGGLLRALLLLCSFPLVWALGERGGAGVRVMAFVTFAGLRPRDMDLVARAILPKHYMESLNAVVYDRLWLPATRKVVVTSAPRVMCEWFLKEYMAADAVVGCELQVVSVGRGRYFTGLLLGPAPGPELRQKALREALGSDGAVADVGVVRSSNPLDHLFVPYCKVRAYT
uniref:Glycerol-3-phosphate acyltransferase RAM2/GPAT1-8 HAD-like domain-containing protein n=1 Tax=Arundo donax TaxID=35708 RepID=A0A0A9B8I1_ARUDO